MAGFDNDTIYGEKLDVGAHPSTGTPYGSFEVEEAGSEVKVQIRNTSNTADSDALIEVRNGGTNGGDPYYRLAVDDSHSWALGVDTDSPTGCQFVYRNDGDATPSSYTNRVWRVDHDSVDPSLGLTRFIVRNKMNVASEGAGNASVGLNSNGEGDTIISFSQVSAAGDARIGVGLTANNWDIGWDGSDNYLYITQHGTTHWPPDSTNTKMKMTTAGVVTFPKTSAFSAQAAKASNVTGAGTKYNIGTTVAYTEIFDQNSDFNTNGTFTAPVTGRYLLSGFVSVTDLTAAMVSGVLHILTSNREYFPGFINAGAARGDPASQNRYVFPFSVLADMDANDTAYLQIEVVSGAGDTADVTATFGGILVC